MYEFKYVGLELFQLEHTWKIAGTNLDLAFEVPFRNLSIIHDFIRTEGTQGGRFKDNNNGGNLRQSYITADQIRLPSLQN